MMASAYERAAVIFASCIPDSGANGALRFLEDGVVDGVSADAYIQCLSMVTDGCAGAYACGISFANDGNDCPTECNGDVLTGCDDTWRFTTDCAAFGLTCAGNQCRPAGAATCADGTPEACNGDVATACNDGYVVEEDCAADGRTCGFDPDFEIAFCKTSDTPCGGMTRCNGASIESCDPLDNVLTTNCEAGETCHQIGMSDPFCGTAEACDPSGDPTCNGNVLTACHGGATIAIDCTTLGFTTCTSDGDATRCGPGW